MVVFIPTWVTLVGWLRVAHLMMITFMMTMIMMTLTLMTMIKMKMAATVRMITMMKTSRKLGDTVPSWLELFLELVLIPEVIANSRISMEMDGQGIKRPFLWLLLCLKHFSIREGLAK